MKVRRSAPEMRTLDGIVFDSIAEMNRYATLKLLERQGLIEKLSRQMKFDLVVKGLKVGTYTPDFVYIDRNKNAFVVEDVKGWKKSKKTGRMLPRVDREFHLKLRLMKACLGIEVTLV